LVVGCVWLFPGRADAIKFGKVTDEEWELGAPEDYPEAPALVLVDDGHMEVGTSNITLERHVRIKILTADGVDLVGERSFFYHDEYDKVKNLKAHTITPDGKQHKVEKDAMFVRSIGNVRERVLTFPQLAEGCIIEYSYKVVSERFRYLAPWYFQSNIYTLESSFSVTLSSGFTYNVSYQNVPPQERQPTEEVRPDVDRGGAYKIITYTWRQTNLPPITDEPYMAAEENYRSSLKFQLVKYEDPYNNIVFVESWPKLGEDFQESLDIYCNKRKDIRKLAEEVTAGLSTPLDKSKALYRYVARNYATADDYIYKFFVHEKADKMLEEMRGSEEEKNLLLTWLHQESGLRAWPVLISTRYNGLVNPQNTSLQQFDHIISYVQFADTYVLLDAQHETSPYGLLPPECLVDVGFMIDGDQSALIRIEMLNTLSYRADVTRMFVDQDGLAVCSTECRLSGYWASSYGRWYERKEPEEFAHEYFVDRLPGECTLGGYSCALDTTNEFVATIDFTSSDLVTKLDNNLVIKPIIFSYRNNPFKSEKRFFPVDFMYPFTYHSITIISLADSMAEVTPPKPLAFEMAGASFERSTIVDDGLVTVSTKLVIEKPLFSPAGYGMLRQFFDNVAQSCEDELAVVLASGAD